MSGEEAGRPFRQEEFLKWFRGEELKMICPWIRSKLGNICDLPSGPRQVTCKGNQFFCNAPLELMLVDSDPVVKEEETEWKFLVDQEKYIRGR